jgi:hypothetical protein
MLIGFANANVDKLFQYVEKALEQEPQKAVAV